MFGSGKNEKGSKGEKKAPINPNAINTLVVGSQFEGNFRSANDIRIDGEMKGNLHCEARLIIGQPGSFEGDAECQSAVIEGNFDGNLIVSDILQIKEKAIVNGIIKTKKLIVQSGAVFNVKCTMGEQNIAADTQKVKTEKEGNKPATS
jgi:cytoskeletal protein CcmA (bactofilin family)